MDVFKGLSWMGALRGITRSVAFLRIALLARVLNPVQFGLFGITSIVLALLEILTETGINPFLIQESKNIKKYLDTAWVISIVRGIFITVMLLILAKPVSLFFNSPDAYNLLVLTSLIPLTRGFINPAEVKYQISLEFNKEFTLRLIVYIVDVVVSIILAVLLRSAISLVWGMLAGTLTELLISVLYISPKPSLKIKKYQFKYIFKRGKWITLSGIFNYLFENIDDIAVGKLMNPYFLGLYQTAYKISGLPISEGGEVLQKVAFPVYSKIEKDGDRERLKRAFNRVLLGTSGLFIPFGLIVIIFPYQIVSIVLGNNWLEIVPVLRLLAILGMLRAVFGSSAALFLAIKKQEYITLFTLVAIVGLSLTIIPFVKNWGLFGAGASALLGWILAIPLIIILILKQFRGGH